MADNRELSTLMRHLNEKDLKDVRFVRTCIYEMLMLCTSSCDISPALPTVVKLLAHPDAFVKRVAGEIIAIYGEHNSEMVLLATNTLLQDCRDVNPVVRGLGLRTLASIQSETSVDSLSSAISSGLEDSSPYVRKNAAFAAIGLHQMAPTSVTEGEIWDLLYSHLSDNDPLTVAGCLCAIEEIFSKEKGTVISNKLGQYLINALPSFSTTVQRLVLQFLLKHSPKTKAKVFEHLNSLDDALTKSDSLALTICSLETFCHLTSSLPKVRSKVYPMAWKSITNNLARERNEETVGATIEYLNLIDFPMNVCAQDFKKFFCREDDHQFLMNNKICLLSKMITSENAELILNEFLSCSRHVSPQTVETMVRNVAKCVEERPEVEAACIDFFINLLEMGNADIFSQVLTVLPWATLDDTNWQRLLTCVCQNFSLVESLQGQISLLELLRYHGSLVKSVAPEILHKILKGVEKSYKIGHMQSNSVEQEGVTGSNSTNLCLEEDEQLKLSLLGAMVSLCMDMPGQIQPMLSRFMDLCLNDSSRRVKDRAKFLYGLLLVKVQDRI